MSIIETTEQVIPTGSWAIDPAHSRVEFAVKHLGIVTIKGLAREFSGRLASNHSGAELEGIVQAASITTSDEQRDAHLASPDFFDVERYPEIVFRGTAIEPNGADGIRVRGELTLKGVTKEVDLEGALLGPTGDPWGNERIGLELEGTIDRHDFGISFNAPLPSGGFVIGDDVRVLIGFSLVKEG